MEGVNVKMRSYLLVALLKGASLFPDETFLRLRYWLQMGECLNLKNPKTFQEKIQWLKLYNRKPEYTQMVDKLAVKAYVAERIGNQFVIPTLGVWDRPEDLDFTALPKQFVLKTTHGGGSNGVIVCRDKDSMDISDVRAKMRRAMSADIYSGYREWPYKNVPRRIIAEEFLEMPNKLDLTDYKIFCFNGEPRYIQVIQDRHTGETIDFFDTEWVHQEFWGLNPKTRQASTPPACPPKLKEMLDIARTLAIEIPFVRVDMYSTSSGIYFGEMTFFPASGIGTFTPDKWNHLLGQMINLPDKYGK